MRAAAQELGWWYLAAIGFAFATLGAFAWLAEEVLEQEFSRFNHSVNAFALRFGGEPLDTIVLAITHLGDPGLATLVSLIALTAFVLRRRIVDAVSFASVMIGGGILSIALKLVFSQQRPIVVRPFVTQPSDYSFPSGHSLISLCLYGFFALWLLLDRRRIGWRWVAALPLVLLPVLVGLSRIYLGVHWPTDVAAGFLLGSFWLAVNFAGRHWMLVRQRRIRTERPTE